MEITEKKIVKVLTNILERVDSLEIQQQRNKEFSAAVKKRLMDLNEFVNDVIDIVEGEHFEDEQLSEQKLSKYTDLRRVIDKELDEHEFEIEFMDSIVGES